ATHHAGRVSEGGLNLPLLREVTGNDSYVHKNGGERRITRLAPVGLSLTGGAVSHPTKNLVYLFTGNLYYFASSLPDV
ncbi:hypothetical protein, partial [Hymenobacter amundsenii]|uniref:hypothetical protein n=1 Tax=Hymenobacter amundsenii TaxID=2006685 RepID=UPI001A8DCFC8